MTNNTHPHLPRILELIDAGDIDNAEEYIILAGLDLSRDDVTAIMTAVRVIDPTESTDAAQIRDALRNNTEFTI